jgi:SAM-dependent methyltransferase
MENFDRETVSSFGDEWSKFDQTRLDTAEAARIFEHYFAIFPWSLLPANASGYDMGCGTGRWARFVAARVGHLHCIDPSNALAVAESNLADCANVSFHSASVGDSILPPNSQDFGYALGVLHHVPDPRGGMASCVDMLKPGAPFLCYLYYAFENRSTAFRFAWRCSDWLRRGISRLPAGLKAVVSDALALGIYYPLTRIALLAERLGLDPANIPLAYYRKHSFYTMRTDARDRFGTPLERRFSRGEIQQMMQSAGLRDVRFSENAPFWCAVGIKR